MLCRGRSEERWSRIYKDGGGSLDQRGGFFGVNLKRWKRSRLGMESWWYLFFIRPGELMAGLWVSFSAREFDTNVAGIHLRGRSSLESGISRNGEVENIRFEYFKK